MGSLPQSAMCAVRPWVRNALGMTLWMEQRIHVCVASIRLSIALLCIAAMSAASSAATPVHGDFIGRIDMGEGRHLYLRCAGHGSPAVFAGVARFTRVCKYDRPGTIRYTNPIALTTRSSPVYGPRTLASMVSDLHAMLTRAGVRAPYVLVAHSYGG